MMSHRDISIKFGEEYGHVELNLGNTKFFTKIYAELVEPSLERPSEVFKY